MMFITWTFLIMFGWNWFGEGQISFLRALGIHLCLSVYLNKASLRQQIMLKELMPYRNWEHARAALAGYKFVNIIVVWIIIGIAWLIKENL